jgi:hypothetical protein
MYSSTLKNINDPIKLEINAVIQKLDIPSSNKINGIIAKMGVDNCHLNMYFNNFFIVLINIVILYKKEIPKIHFLGIHIEKIYSYF